jgi:hypothetical protein
MNKKCNQEMLITYLYDELDPEQKKIWEEHLRECVSCQQEVEHFRALRANMEPSEAPSMPYSIRLPMYASQPNTVVSLYQTTWFRVLISSAAAILLILFSAWFTNLRLDWTHNSLTISFDPDTIPSEQPLNASPEDLELLMAQFRNEQSNLVNSLSDSIRQSQQKQFDQTLAAFQRYLEQRRIEDLELIALSLDEMQQINDTRFVETQYMLSQLVNQMNQELLTVNRR